MFAPPKIDMQNNAWKVFISVYTSKLTKTKDVYTYDSTSTICTNSRHHHLLGWSSWIIWLLGFLGILWFLRRYKWCKLSCPLEILVRWRGYVTLHSRSSSCSWSHFCSWWKCWSHISWLRWGISTNRLLWLMPWRPELCKSILKGKILKKINTSIT